MPTVPLPSYDAALETRVFWERFKTEIISALIIVALAIVGFGAYRFYSDRRAASASAMLASAKSADAYQQVIADYPNTPAAADGYLLLAEAQRKEKKFTEANATLQVFIDKNPNHELVQRAARAAFASVPFEIEDPNRGSAARLRDDPDALPGELLGGRGRPGIAFVETKRLLGAGTNIDYPAIFGGTKRDAGEAKITQGRPRRRHSNIWDTTACVPPTRKIIVSRTGNVCGHRVDPIFFALSCAGHVEAGPQS